MNEAEKRWIEEEAIKFLVKNRNKKFTTREIAEWFFEKHKDTCKQMDSLEKLGNSDNARIRLIRRTIMNIEDSIIRKEPRIKFIKENPRIWYCEL